VKLGWGCVALSAVVMLAGCGGGGNSGNTNPPPPAAPTVSSTSPANHATGVPVTAAITATFSKAMNSSTLTSTTFTLASQGGSGVAGAVTYDSGTMTATFTPAAQLAYSTQYTATITTAASSSDGAALAANSAWSFTTAAAPAPTVSAVSPADGATGVAIGTAVSATFNAAMNASSITTGTFTLAAQGGSAVAGTVSYDATSQTATFTPAASLAYSTTYTATLTAGVTSSAGTALAAMSWSFTTAAPPPLTVSAMTPANGATNVGVTTGVTATFSEAMNAASLTASTFTLTAKGGGAVAGSVTYNPANLTATFTPAASLAYSTQYTATITTGATASNGAALAANVIWDFTTGPAPAPTVTATVPVNGATNVAVNSSVTATFASAMNASTLTTSTFTLTAAGGGAVAGTVTYDAGSMTATFTPSANLAFSTQYTATITTGAQTSNGGSLVTNRTWSFTTTAGVTVDFGTRYQTIRGFGGSTAWLGSLTTQQATALFDPVNGLGLSILRVRIDPTGTATTNNWATSNWAAEATNAQEAIAANRNAIIIATPWTPPAAFKTSDSTFPYSATCDDAYSSTKLCGGYLDPTHDDDYAAYLNDFVDYFANDGVNLYAISMQNEPDATVQYESCFWTGTTMDQWIVQSASVLKAPLMMPESESFNTGYSDPSLNDANAVGKIGIVAGHIYGAAPSYYANAENKGKDVWMTEHYLTPSGSLPAMADALKAAQEVHNSLVTGQYNAYVWWWIWNQPSLGVNYGLINSSTSSPAPTLFGYAIGQFSKFVQPGAVRVSATANPAANIYISAYTNNGHAVIVVINAGTTAPSLAFSVQNAGGVTALTPYQTTSSGGLVPQAPVTVTGGQFTYTLPAQSITTLVQ
jgi:O-glycosyl hydrolase